ncbi:MAG: hypothetical protein U9N35_02250 [Euryarchaeota archaeon]|nr:hypothetical protein [Euryarchaeota archaeon]
MKRMLKKLSFFLLLFLFLFYTTSLFENWSINNDFQGEMERLSQRYKYNTPPKKAEDLSPEELLDNLRINTNYMTNHGAEFYARQPSVFSWIPFQSLKLYYKAHWYNVQMREVFNTWIDAFHRIGEYRTEFRSTIDIKSYKDTEKLRKVYTRWLMNEIPSCEEVKKEFEDISEKLNGATNEKRLKEFYKREMKMLKESYENERPENMLYAIEVLKALETLAENNGATSSESFEDWEIPYGKYLMKTGLIALLQTFFVFVGYWKLAEREKTKKSEE